MRLTGKAPYDRLFKEGRKSADAHVLVLARSNGADSPRLGLAIGRKHFRSGVARNRVKRVIKESFRLHQCELRGLDVLVVARKGLGSLPVKALRAALPRHWQKLSQLDR
jgi:ribonuclease P protein component